MIELAQGITVGELARLRYYTFSKYFAQPSDSAISHPTCVRQLTKLCDIGRAQARAMISMSSTQGLAQHPFALSPTSPTSTRGFKRSASSDEDDQNGDGDSRPHSARRNTAVKRACNECRQQKVSLS
jgi:hypothetical protein